MYVTEHNRKTDWCMPQFLRCPLRHTQVGNHGHTAMHVQVPLKCNNSSAIKVHTPLVHPPVPSNHWAMSYITCILHQK